MENKEVTNWATSYALTAEQLYINFPASKYIRKEVRDIPKFRLILGAILRYFFFLVLNDIIDKNVTFKLPPGTSAYIEMVPVSGDDFAKARQNGAFHDVDYLASDFTGYQLYLRHNTRYGKWLKRIYVSRKMRDKITANTNAGKKYG